MINPPLHSPRSIIGGIYHFGRMVDKIRCHLKATLPEEYRPNLNFSVGLDGHLCGFLGVSFQDLIEKVKEGLSDEELLEWCLDQGIRLKPGQKRVGNGFVKKFGWRDRASGYLNQ